MYAVYLTFFTSLKYLSILFSIRELRKSKTKLSCNKLANEFDIGNGNLNRIENGVVDCKVITLWKITEALGMKPSEFIKLMEDKLGDKFTLIDE